MGVHKKSKGIMKKKNNHAEKDSNSVNKHQKNRFQKSKKPQAKIFPMINSEIKSTPKIIDIEALDKQLETLNNNQDNVTKKIRKKIRQLEYLKKKYTQIQNTQNSLKADDPEKDSNDDDDDNEDGDKNNDNNDIVIKNGEKDAKKSIKAESMKGIQRFVVFVGNLPKLTTEEDIKTHFANVGNIKSVRIPDDKEERKKGFAFLEVEDSISFEKTLSMHHTMLGNKRINVLYTNPDGKNLDIKEIRKKNAKFNAMRKSGLLAGSVAEHKKRSFRRKKKRLAEEKASTAMKAF